MGADAPSGRSAVPSGVLSAWFQPGSQAALAPLGEGFINDTWLVTAPAAHFVLQRINQRVFSDPVNVMTRVAAVVAHLERSGKVAVPPLIVTRHGSRWHETAPGEVWRLWGYLPRTRTLERLSTVAQAQAAGRAFGAFQQGLAGLSLPGSDPIPGFLQLPHYLTQFDRALRAPSRALDADTETAVAAVAPRRELAGLFQRRDRLVHGDCKVSNLLFHQRHDRVACVLDLDTVMRGHWAWDLGDLVRSAAADSGDLCLYRYRAVLEGFRASGAGETDRESLVMAPRYVTFMLAVRFLTDHLNGDRYFKVSRPGDNLHRAREQLRLLEAMERQEPAMRNRAEGV